MAETPCGSGVFAVLFYLKNVETGDHWKKLTVNLISPFRLNDYLLIEIRKPRRKSEERLPLQ